MSCRNTNVRTVSEVLFEEYLRINGHAEFEFEPRFDGKKKRPDYRLSYCGRDLLFEVKERSAPAQSPRFAWFNPYRGIRDEINEATRKFKEFKEFCCCLVIINLGDPNTLLDAEHIFGAMLGDLGFTIGVLGTNDLGERNAIQNVFLPSRGKMVRYKTGQYQNTTISAVIALEEARLRNNEFECLKHREAQDQRRRLKRELSVDESGALAKRVPRAVVCENPGSRISLSREVLCGPYDERWAIVDGTLTPVYGGVRVREIVAPEVTQQLWSQ